MTNEKILSLLKEMKENCLKIDKIYNDPKATDKAEALNYAIFLVEKVESKKGKWLPCPDWIGIECTSCKGRTTWESDFCPWCGADMREEDSK